ncbi:hypothetical protein AHiyo4_27670 [Arthrobacter sp. Hiyo4]|nr:hypothetical protein AHiyo4_27670 [Arthrobacter sp. Hiyo4]
MLESAALGVYVEGMNRVASQHFGEIELNHGRDHNIAAKHELGGQLLELDLNINAHDHFDEAAMHKVDYRLRFLPELVDEVRQMIADELEQEGTSPQEYLHFHCSALKDEHLQKVFGVEERSQLTNDVFLKASSSATWAFSPASPSATLSWTSPSAHISRTRSWWWPPTKTAWWTTKSSGSPEPLKHDGGRSPFGERPPSALMRWVTSRTAAGWRGPSWWP